MLYLQSIVNIRCNQENRLSFSLEWQLSWLTGLHCVVLNTGLVTSRSGSALTWEAARICPAGASVALVT